MGPALAILLILQQPLPTEPLVEKGTAYLKGRQAELQKDPEFALWTLVTVGVPKTDPVVQGLLQGVLERPPETTRAAALQAMALSVLDPAEHRNRLGHCAQFLVDNQCADGQWDAGRAVEPWTPPKPPPGDVGPPPRREKVLLVRRRDGNKQGDPIHSRWAAWGLLACHQQGFSPLPELSDKAAAAWRSGVHDPADVVACLSTYLSFQQKDWRKDPDVLKALEQLSIEDRAHDLRGMVLLKRALILYGSNQLGGREWWPEGAKLVAAAQSPDGSWGGVDETCWAVLYLHLGRMRWPVPDRR